MGKKLVGDDAGIKQEHLQKLIGMVLGPVGMVCSSFKETITVLFMMTKDKLIAKCYEDNCNNSIIGVISNILIGLTIKWIF